MLKQAKLRYIACLVGVLSVSIAFSGCSTAEAEAIPANAVISESSSQINTVNLDNLYTQTEATYSAYEQNQVSEPDLAKACATAILLQEELTNNVNLQADTVYSEKINKAYDMLLKMDITKPDLQLQGDVAGTFPKLVDATETLVLLVGGEMQEASSNSGVSETLSSVAPPTSSPTSQTSSSPNLNSAKPASQAPKAESKPTSAAPKAESKPTSTAPTPAPAPKPESKPESKATPVAPAPAPVTPAKPAPEPAKPAPAPAPAPQPSTGSIKTLYNGATYGATDQSQYDAVINKANSAKSSGDYSETYALLTGDYKDSFETAFGVPYSDTWADIASLTSYTSSGGQGSGSTGSAYNYFTGKSSMCGDTSKATQAVLQANGYDAKLAWGTRNGVSHMWTMVKVGGQWYHLSGKNGYGTSVPSGYKMTGSGYNYG